ELEWADGAADDVAEPAPAKEVETNSAREQVVVDTPYGKRVSRRRESASIGRKARERRLAALRKTANQAERIARDLEDEAKQLDATLQDLAELSRVSNVWLAGTQAPRLAKLNEDIDAVRTRLGAAEERVRTLPVPLEPLRDTVSRLRPLLSSASLLDFSTLEDELTATQKALAEAQTQRALAEATLATRQELSETFESLRSPPTDPAELTALQTARQSIVAERDRAFQLLESVRQLRAHAYARDWSDAERRLKETGGLVPALEEEHEASILRLQKLEQQLALAEQAWEEQTALAQKASGEVVALQAHISRAETELEAEGLLALTLPEQQQRLAELNRESERLDAECTALR